MSLANTVFSILVLVGFSEIPRAFATTEKVQSQLSLGTGECSEFLQAVATNNIVATLDEIELWPEEVIGVSQKNLLWFLEANPNFFDQPPVQERIKAVNINTQHGVAENIFYPFGGIDVVTAANSPSVHTIYSAQLAPFGNIAKGLKTLSDPQYKEQVIKLEGTFFDSIASGWISSGTLQDASDLTQGLGVHALLVIRRLMRANILAIGYLSFKDGIWTEHRMDNPPLKTDHGFIEFNYQGRTIKYFFLRADLSDEKAVLGQTQAPINPDDIQILFGGQKFDSILRHIHGAQKRLKSDFSQLLNLLSQSERIFTSGPEEEPFESFPNFEVVMQQDRLSNWSPFFGAYGPMAILWRQSSHHK